MNKELGRLAFASAMRWRLPCSGVALALIVSMVLPGCAQSPKQSQFAESEKTSWNGRMALTVEAQPPQFFAAQFELAGNPQTGQLTLRSPLGNTIGSIAWDPEKAVLQRNAKVQQFDSLDALLQQTTGTPIPVPALFCWLRGQAQPVAGWQVDLSRLQEGRLQASRLNPLPSVLLRLVLDP